MKLQSLLNEKGHKTVTTNVQTPIADVCALLAEYKIGAVVVSDETQAVLGIISERDIVRVLASEGAKVLQSPASTIMTKNVITTTGQESVLDAMQKMSSGRFRHMPVVENGKLAGIISIGDVVKQRIQQVEKEAEDIRSYIVAS